MIVLRLSRPRMPPEARIGLTLAAASAFFAGLVPTWQSGALACGMLGATAVLSALFPARRAASVDPIEALRFEAGG